MLASESVALDMLSFELVRDVAPGEAVFIDEQGRLHSQQCVATVRHTPCIFEYVYFARPDSIIDNISVYRARMRMGEKLADKIMREHPDHDIDVVIPIPDTSRTSALQMAQILGIKYREGFNKNRYIGRTFIMPGQEQRERSVRRKLNAIDLEFRGKNVLLVDDSIVRGTTSAQIIDLAREAGAKKVYFASAAPPVRFPNVYGIDMPASSELVAAGRSVEEVAPVHRRRLAGVPGSRRPGERLPARQRQDRGVRHVLLLRRVRHRRCDRRIPGPSAACALGRGPQPAAAGALGPEGDRGALAPAALRGARHRSSGRSLHSCSAERMRLLLVEEDPIVRSLIRHHVSCNWPEAQISAHPPLLRGPLPAEFLAQGYDAVLLSDPPSRGQGLTWLRELTSRPGFAPVIFLLEHEDEALHSACPRRRRIRRRVQGPHRSPALHRSCCTRRRASTGARCRTGAFRPRRWNRAASAMRAYRATGARGCWRAVRCRSCTWPRARRRARWWCSR